MSFRGKVRLLLTGEPEDPEGKAAWAEEKARQRENKLMRRANRSRLLVGAPPREPPPQEPPLQDREDRP